MNKRVLCLLLALLLCMQPLGVFATPATQMDGGGYFVWSDGIPDGWEASGRAVPVCNGVWLVESASDVTCLRAVCDVSYVEPNGDLTLMGQWNMDAVNASAAWAHQDSRGNYDRRGNGVTVAVIDSGVQADHPDLPNVLPYHDLKKNENGVDIWHGTFVAGLIAAQVDNGVGVDGAAPEVQILPICITQGGTSDTFTAIRAIQYAVKQKVDVINLSIGGGKDSRALELACREAADAGIILVAAAGNYQSGETHSEKEYIYPASYDCVVSVSGIKEAGLAFDENYSYYNDAVNVCAPGTSVRSLYLGGSVATASGTSFAAPIVSAMAAIAKQCNRAITTETFLSLLSATAKDLGPEGYDVRYGAGLVDLDAFVTALDTAYPISYRSEGETLSGLAPASYTVGDAAIALPTPVREGYSFAGWYDNPELSGTPVTELPAASLGARTYYAAWDSRQPSVLDGAPQTGTAAPASLDGGTAAVPYQADVSAWFCAPGGGALRYHLADGAGTLEGSLLTYMPAAADALSVVTLRVEAENDAGRCSHSVSIQVGALPQSQPALRASAPISLNLCALPENISVPLSLYGSQVTAVTLDHAALSWQLADETLLLPLPEPLAEGAHSVQISFDIGDPVELPWSVYRDCPSAAFIDVAPGLWFHSAVDYAVTNRLMNGLSASVFDPNGSVTRAQLVTILYRMAGSPAVTTAGTFSDVKPGLWYYAAIEWAAAHGIVNGVGGSRFQPDGKVTREQIAAILYRYQGAPAAEGTLSNYPDGAAVSAYALDAMRWATGEKLIGGVASNGETRLLPRDSATRAQLAAIIMRLVG